jgi:hypothetical protein
MADPVITRGDMRRAIERRVSIPGASASFRKASLSKALPKILAERAVTTIGIEAVTLTFTLSSFDKPRAHIAKLLCVAMLIGLQSISLRGQSHVSEPAVNLGDTTFLDGPAGPGFVTEQIGDAAHNGRITGSAGNAVSGAGAVNSISGLTHVAWLS